MKIEFLKDVSFALVDYKSGKITDEIPFRKGEIVKNVEVIQLSKGFSDIVLPTNEIITDVSNDCFRTMVE